MPILASTMTRAVLLNRPPTVAALVEGSNLITNPGFETNTTGWGGFRVGIARQTADTPNTGVGHLRCDRSVTTAPGLTYYDAGGGRMAATAGLTYRFRVALKLWVMVTAQLKLVIDWYDSGGGVISSANGSTITPGAYASYNLDAVAPALTVTAVVSVHDPGAGSTSPQDTWYIDDAFFGTLT